MQNKSRHVLALAVAPLTLRPGGKREDSSLRVLKRSSISGVWSSATREAGISK